MRVPLLKTSCGRSLSPYAGKASAQDDFKTYSNKQDRYHIEYPAAWKETSKSGASVLLQDPERKSTTVGVTVTPVRIAKLEEIGDPSAVAEKLIAAEKAKVSALCITEIYLGHVTFEISQQAVQMSESGSNSKTIPKSV